MKVVSDTSPLIALSKVGQLIILKKLFGKVSIPASVANEFFGNCTLSEKESFIRACQSFIETIEVTASYRFHRNLGTGERDALTLAIYEKADILIIDDRKAFNEAAERRVVAVSTRAVLRIASEKNIIEDYHQIEQELRKRSFFLPNY